MKKITNIRIAPLEQVVLLLEFEKSMNINLTKAGIIPGILKENFQKEPNFVLLPLLAPGQTVELPALGPLRFHNEENDQTIELGKNYIRFIFKKYHDWSTVLPIFVNSILKLKDILELEIIKHINLTYIDRFTLPRDGFTFKRYFTIHLNTPEDWEILPHDIFIGVLLSQDENEKIIVRLRSLREVEPESSELKYDIETVFIDREIGLKVEAEELNKYLTYAHDKIEQYFIDFLTQELRDKIGMKIDE